MSKRSSITSSDLQMFNRVGLSGSGCVACVQEVVCGGWTRLLHCGREIGVDCSLATYSGVELAVPKTACCQFHQAARDSVCPMRGSGVKLFGRIMGSCPEVRPRFSADDLRIEHRMTTTVCPMRWWPAYRASDDYHGMPDALMTRVSSIGWLPLYARCADDPRIEHRMATTVCPMRWWPAYRASDDYHGMPDALMTCVSSIGWLPLYALSCLVNLRYFRP